jgi:hypothetical protein
MAAIIAGSIAPALNLGISPVTDAAADMAAAWEGALRFYRASRKSLTKVRWRKSENRFCARL